jgi:uncharacterized membrane protein
MQMKRIPSIDIARGLVMVIMALDHTRDYLHIHAAQSPTDLATTTPILFFTRWITHLCAPTFVFLSGASAWLSLHAGPSVSPSMAASMATAPDELRRRRRFLLNRGLLLVAIEFTLVNFGLSFDLRFRLFIFEVIAAIGTGLILVSLLSRLSPKIVLAIACLLFFGHDLIFLVPMPTNSVLGFIGSLFFGPGAFPYAPGRLFVIAYPVLPWLGIMLAGFCAGQLFTLPIQKRRILFLRLGLGALALFVLLRLSNWYGDPFPWTHQRSGAYTFLSFMNLAKYPPSLLFGLATLGILLLILSAAEGRDNALTRFLLVYGRVPLFYFVVHIYLIHLLLLVTVTLQGYPWSGLDFGPFKFGRPDHAGLPLGGVYLVWAAVVLALYPLCRWYGRCKARHKEKIWLSYL